MYNVPLPTEDSETVWSEVDGGLLVENATLLAEGTWNGIDYEAKDLAKAANKWRDNTVWNRHYEDKQRDETNRIGFLSNQHFDTDKIVGDVFLSDETPEGQKMISLVKEHKVKGLSVEHVDRQIDNKSTDIQFLGIAVVPEPACNICNLSKEGANMGDQIKELTKEDIQTIVKEQTDTIISELSARIKKLEDIPNPSTVTGSESLEDSYASLVIEHGVSRRSDE